MTNANPSTQLMDIATRISGMREILGYRIGPFEIESTIMELSYVLGCGVCAAPDEIRGQVVQGLHRPCEGYRRHSAMSETDWWRSQWKPTTRTVNGFGAT